MKFSIQEFFSTCDQIRRKLRIWSHLLKKSSVPFHKTVFIHKISTPENYVKFLAVTIAENFSSVNPIRITCFKLKIYE